MSCCHAKSKFLIHGFSIWMDGNPVNLTAIELPITGYLCGLRAALLSGKMYYRQTSGKSRPDRGGCWNSKPNLISKDLWREVGFKTLPYDFFFRKHRNISIFSTWRRYGWWQLSLMDNKDQLCISQSQNRGTWYPDIAKSHSTNRHGIGAVCPGSFTLSTSRRAFVSKSDIHGSPSDVVFGRINFI